MEEPGKALWPRLVGFDSRHTWMERTHGAHLLNIWDMLVQVIEAHSHGEEGKSNEKEPGGFAEPGAVQ